LFNCGLGADDVISAGSGPTDAATVVQNFLNSLKSGQGIPRQQQLQGQIYTTLPDLLPSSITIPTIDSATPTQIDNLLSYLPPTILLIAQESAASIDGMVEPNDETATRQFETVACLVLLMHWESRYKMEDWSEAGAFPLVAAMQLRHLLKA